MIARNAERLARLSDEIEETYAYPCDVGDLDALERTIAAVQLDVGAVRSVVHNAVAFSAGYLTATIGGVSEYNRRAITIETGIQNSGLGLILIFGFFNGFRALVRYE